jgi:ATP-dependent protease ClpP protease subunit
MSGEEAKEYGIVDGVISSIKDKEKDRRVHGEKG